MCWSGNPASTLACVQIGACPNLVWADAQFFIDVRAGWGMSQTVGPLQRPNTQRVHHPSTSTIQAQRPRAAKRVLRPHLAVSTAGQFRRSRNHPNEAWPDGCSDPAPRCPDKAPRPPHAKNQIPNVPTAPTTSPPHAPAPDAPRYRPPPASSARTAPGSTGRPGTAAPPSVAPPAC